METPVVYFGTLNADALNKKASDYFKSDILNNPDLSLIDAEDEDFKEVVRLIELNYPKALPNYVEPVSDEPTLEELKESFEGAKLTVDFLEGSKKQDMQDYIDSLEILIESMSFENGGDEYAKGGGVNYPTDLKVGNVLQGVGFPMLKGIDGGNYYTIVEMDNYSATMVKSDKNGNKKGVKKVRHKLDSIEGAIKTATRGDENGILVVK